MHEDIQNLTKAVEALNGNITEFRTQLFGSAEGENPKGRIPQLEAKVEKLEKKIETWTRRAAYAAGFTAALGTVGTILYYIIKAALALK